MMIGRVDHAQEAAMRRAELIYAQARSELSTRLWQAALGAGDGSYARTPKMERSAQGVSLDSLMALMMARDADDAAPARRASQTKAEPLAIPTKAEPVVPAARAVAAERPAGLGVNAGFTNILQASAVRTGIPAPALAAIVNAEAAKDEDGRWRVYSRNPRSSAAGLGQFLSGTWRGEAERSGTWLNSLCIARGWVDGRGKVIKEARSQLLALRYDPEASINAIADYAKGNLDRLRSAGVHVGQGLDDIAQAAYFGHHLGIGDAIKFMKGGLQAGRARRLLDAQIGNGAANRRIAETGDAVSAHRNWLLGFVGRNIRPARFAALQPVGPGRVS
ncbi:peptidoglycan-binding protein [Sphingobium boeckii]